jgi:hypothetical protein
MTVPLENVSFSKLDKVHYELKLLLKFVQEER